MLAFAAAASLVAAPLSRPIENIHSPDTPVRDMTLTGLFYPLTAATHN